MPLPALLCAFFFGLPALNVPDGAGASDPDPSGGLALPAFPDSPTLKAVEKAAKPFVASPKAKPFATYDGNHLTSKDGGLVLTEFAPTVSSDGFVLDGHPNGDYVHVLLSGLKKGHRYLVVLKVAGTSGAKLRFLSDAASATVAAPTKPSLLPIGFTASAKEDGFSLRIVGGNVQDRVSVGAVEIYSLED